MSTQIEKIPFGELPGGSKASLFRFTNDSGALAEITDYGGRLVRILVPDKNENLVSVIKGYDNIQGYLQDGGNYLGATCGRFANRISKARFVAGGEEFKLFANDGENSLHGGVKGFHVQLWDSRIEGEYVIMKYISRDNEEGFPGNFAIEVTFSWSETCELSIQIIANTTKCTPVNITNHAYFNLDGEGDILEHKLQINGNRYLPIHSDAIPTGEIRFVHGTAFDFSEPKAIGQDICNEEEQLLNGNGYDHCFVINKDEFGDLVKAADAFSPKTGIGLSVYTTMPGVQFYSGNYLKSDVPAHDGNLLAKRQAFCLEPEFFPDSPNQSGFPNCVLSPEDTFEETIIFQFY